MAWTRSPLHHLIDRTEVKLTRIGLGIDLLDRRHKDHIGPGCLQQGGIRLGRTRITAQIILIVELRGIDKDAHYNRLVFTTSLLDKRPMAGMQCTHRWDKSDPFRRTRCKASSQFTDRSYYFHDSV